MPSAQHRQAIAEALGKPCDQASALWVANAVDVEPEHHDWVPRSRAMLADLGFALTDLDLRDYLDNPSAPELARTLASADLLWINGGNTFYLRWLMRASGADQLISEAVANGLVYGGGSAGAIVAGPTLNHFQPMDAPELAPELVLDGLGLTDQVVVPHIDNSDFASAAEYAQRHLERDGYPTLALTDSQIAIIRGETVQVR